MIARLKNIAPVQFALVCGVLYGLLGLIGALFLVPFSMLGAMAVPNNTFGPAFGLAGLIIFPIVYGVVGFIVSLITALLYNAVSGMTGGIEVTLETVSPGVQTGYSSTV